MEEDKIELIKKLIEEGNGRHEARRRVLSLGYGTENFNALYDSVLAQMGVSEPKDAMPDLSATGELALEDPRESSSVSLFGKLKTALVFIALIVAVAVGGYSLFSYVSMPKKSDAPIEWGKAKTAAKQNQELGFGDTVLQAKVKATTASARIYGKRMEGYGGMCKDISVVEPIVCQETEQTFVVYVPLSNGTYYCEDTAENSVFVAEKPQGGVSCK